jgi:putative transposase
VSRPPRLEVPGGVFHIVARGNERRPIFADAVDRTRFLELLEKVAERFRWRVLCYCLMGNHYHLLVKTLAATLARGMRELNGVYAQWFNRRHVRVGHLFQGRYKAILVQQDEHLLSTLLYIVRNPLRAGLCQDLGEWLWSSHLATIGGCPPGPLALDELLQYFGPTRPVARARYRRLLELEHDSRLPAHPLVDGEPHYVVSFLEQIDPSPEHTRAHLRAPRPPLRELLTDTSDLAAIAHANRDHGYSMRQIATHLNCSPATISRRIQQHASSDET